MKAEQQKQAESLYFQSGLTKTEIAQIIGVSRRSLHYWIRQNNWDSIRESARAMPIALVGNCYLILSKLQESILSPERAGKPVTPQEANTQYRLITTIEKLNARGALSENLEMMASFTEFVNGRDPRAAQVLKPIVKDYITSRASAQFMPTPAAVPVKEDPAEAQLDLEDVAAWAQAANPGAPVTDPAPIQAATQSPAPSSRSQHSEKTTAGNTVQAAKDTVSSPPPVIKGKANNRAARRLLARTAA